MDASGNLYIVDEASCEVRKVTAGTINAFAGQFELGYSGDGGPATSALLADPLGVAVDGSGTVYIADTINNRIRTVSGGVIAEYAGATHSQGDGGKASAAVLFYPQQLAWDAQGNMYIADTDNNEVRKVAANGTISTVAGNGTFSSTGDGGPALSAGVVKPQAVAVDSSGNLYIASGNQVRMVDTKGNISTIVNTAGTAGLQRRRRTGNRGKAV